MGENISQHASNPTYLVTDHKNVTRRVKARNSFDAQVHVERKYHVEVKKIELVAQSRLV